MNMQDVLAEGAVRMGEVGSVRVLPDVAAAAWHLARQSDTQDGAMAEFAGAMFCCTCSGLRQASFTSKQKPSNPEGPQNNEVPCEC